MENEEDFDEEEGDSYDGPSWCSYCNSEVGETFTCKAPEIVDLKDRGYYMDIQPICDECCSERILEGSCINDDCEKFNEHYPRIRVEKITEMLTKKNVSYIVREDNSIIPEVDNPYWGYFFFELPDRFTPIEEIIEEDFKIVYFTGINTKLMISDGETDYYSNTSLIDLFKDYYNDFKITNYYTYSEEFEHEGEMKKSMLLIIKFTHPDYYDRLPEYLVNVMRTSNYRGGERNEYIHDPYQIRIRTRTLFHFDKNNPLIPLKLYFASMDLRTSYYIEETGIIKTEFRGLIKNQISSNLRLAKERNVNMIIFPEYCFLEESLPLLQNFSNKEKIWVIGGIERVKIDRYNLIKRKNAAIIFIPNKEPIIQLKNFKGKNEPPLIPGRELIIMDSKFGTFCVLVCADFLADDLLVKIKENLDFIIVISFNRDINEFNTRAYNRCFSNYCYIFITNINFHRGYSVHAPFRDNNRNINIPNFPFFEVDLNPFTLFRRRIEGSTIYKTPLSRILNDFERV